MRKKDLAVIFSLLGLLCVPLLFTSFSSSVSVADDYILDDLFTPDSLDDVVINLTTNKTGISFDTGVLADLTVNNTGSNTLTDLNVDFAFESEYALFSPKFAPHQSLPSLAPHTSSTFQIELILNDSLTQDEIGFDSADVCLVFDCSGSMGNEIEDVKTEFLQLTSRLSESIPSLRFSMIVYGWARYSEYPTKDSRNYIDFTDDFTSVNNFISELSATGSVEPWGDALYLANSFSWRDDIPKLLVIVGDEDCDPGKIVGRFSSDSYYNGSQLVDAVQDLKDKGIIISSIMTDGGWMVANQFNWIAEYTGGEMINLVELNSLEGPISVSELIEDMTLSMGREYFIELIADVSWTENSVDYTFQESVYIVVDFAPPAIAVSTTINEELNGKCSLGITATVRDLSGVQFTHVYWTEEDLTINPEPLWNFTPMTTKIEDSYIEIFTDLIKNQKFSFFIVSQDLNGNYGQTDIYNLTITITPITFGLSIEFAFIQDDSYSRFYFDFAGRHDAYLWVDNNNTNLDLIFEDQVNFTESLVYQEDNYTIYHVENLLTNDFLPVLFSGDISSSIIKLRWDSTTLLQNYELDQKWSLDDTISNRLFLIELSGSFDGYLSLLLSGSPLIAKALVFDLAWNKIGTVSASSALQIDTNNSYYVWVYRVIRTGEFELYYDSAPWEDDDPYYTVYYGIPLSSILAFAAILLLSMVSYLIRRIRKK